MQSLESHPPIYTNMHQNLYSRGSLGGSVVWCLPSAQGVILESQDRIPHRAPCMEPASPLSALLMILEEKSI